MFSKFAAAMTKKNAAEASEGWVSVGLLFLPGIPLWFFWGELLRLSGGYGEIVAGFVIFLQVASLLLLRPPLMRRIQDLSRWLDACRKKRRSDCQLDVNPALTSLQDTLRSMPETRVRELVAIATDLARQDREQNVRVALTRMQSAKPKASTHSEEVNTILRRVDERVKELTPMEQSLVDQILAKRRSKGS